VTHYARYLLQCVASCCSVLQCVSVCCSAVLVNCISKLRAKHRRFQPIAYYIVLQCVAECCSVLQCVAVWFNALQCVATRCSVLQCHLSKQQM